jgi:16S rRNA (adenine1518-N6/adenine1519-N6)-dimethyltransferase
LTDGAFLSRITAAAELAPDDLVIEVGPGRGSLTRRLVQHAGQVIAVEMDPGLAAALPDQLGNPPNLAVLQADARTVDIGFLLGDHTSYKVVSNLPYYAANPIIRRFLEVGPRPSLMVVMVQREVSQNMLAKPGNMGILSVAVQFYAIPKLVCQVPPKAFRPPPQVSSSVVRLDVRRSPAVAVDDTAAFFEVVRAGFSAPRKQLRNSLSQGLNVTGSQISRLLDSLNLDGRRRAETLTLEEWAQVYRAWQNFANQPGR